MSPAAEKALVKRVEKLERRVLTLHRRLREAEQIVALAGR